jgi:6-phosphogluconolactonase
MKVDGEQLSKPELVAETKNPSYVALHPNGRTLYSVCETSDHEGKPEGGVEAYSRNEQTGELSKLGSQPSGSKGPCYVSVDPTGSCVAVANYAGGSVALLRVAPDGSLTEVLDHHVHSGSSVNEKRQSAAHAHSAVFDHSGAFLYVPDLGMDRVVCYEVDRRELKLREDEERTVRIEPGSGPRHLIFHPSGSYAYLANELTSTVMSFEYSPGRLSLAETHSMLPEEFSGTSTAADIHLSYDGKHLFASNRGHDSLAIFRVGEDPKHLEPAGHVSVEGEVPRNFTVHPSEPIVLVANQKSDSITLFRYSPEQPILEYTGVSFEVGAPVCLKWSR